MKSLFKDLIAEARSIGLARMNRLDEPEEFGPWQRIEIDTRLVYLKPTRPSDDERYKLYLHLGYW